MRPGGSDTERPAAGSRALARRYRQASRSACDEACPAPVQGAEWGRRGGHNSLASEARTAGHREAEVEAALLAVPRPRGAVAEASGGVAVCGVWAALRAVRGAERVPASQCVLGEGEARPGAARRPWASTEQRLEISVAGLSKTDRQARRTPCNAGSLHRSRRYNSDKPAASLFSDSLRAPSVTDDLPGRFIVERFQTKSGPI